MDEGLSIQGCGSVAMGFLMILVLAALVVGAVALSSKWADASQSQAAARAQEAQARQVEAKEETERLRERNEHDREMFEHWTVALAAFTSRNDNVLFISILSGVLGAVVAAVAISWLNRRL